MKAMLSASLVFTLIVFSAVSAAEDRNPPLASDAFLQSGAKKLDFTRYVSASKPIDVMIMWDMNPADCRPLENPSEHELTKEPEHGTAEVMPMTGHANFASDRNAMAEKGKRSGIDTERMTAIKEQMNFK